MKLSRSILSLILAWLLLLTAGVIEAVASERITDYRVAIEVNKDRTVDITEVIEVNVEGDQIKRGLLRDIPETYRRRDGRYVNINPKVRAVRRDGNDEPFSTSHEGRYFRIRIGDAYVMLQNGLHTYEISYSVEQSIGFFDDYDEIYWNAIGTEWAFPIERSQVSVRAPEGGEVLQYAAYTGSSGSRGDSYRVTEQSDQTIAFQATRELNPGEGMTVAVAWPKGLIAEPSESRKALNSFFDNSPLYIVLFGAICQFIWLIYSWIKVGRDPDGGPIIPLYRPPEKISPAIASYIKGMGEFEEGEEKTFMAALISLGTKGLLTIREEGKSVVVERANKPDPAGDKNKPIVSINALPPGEKALFKALFHKADTVKFADMKFAQMSKIMSAFTTAIDREADETYYHENLGRTLIGFLMTFAVAALFVVLKTFFAPPFEFPILEVVSTVFLSIVLAILFLGAGALLPSRLESGLKAFILAAIAGAAIYILVVGQETIIPGLWDIFAIVPVLVVLFMWLLGVAFYAWMKAPTLLGRAVMDKIDGLKLFMTVTVAQKAEELNDADMPELTPKLYEDLLPYAIALGVEQKWSKTFEKKVFSQLPPDRSYHPVWYVGHFDPERPTASLTTVTEALGADLSSAMTPPASSSSGSGGGGSSGGGGGGGGGGGW
nr:DUF2207 domain-containing protein [uncultured Cohaesibacter sp.]